MKKPRFSTEIAKDMEPHAERVAQFLKGMASPHRLIILCQLSGGERSVTQLITATGIAQTSMSQHLAKLRTEGIVSVRRDHRTLFYAIEHPMADALMQVLHDYFCAPMEATDQTPTKEPT
ncbi:MAG: metalloregulator ArsR/SmtB family transcription factor [Chromatiales bacterium]|jgi:DNA-binding transcriptional ArsR family regulator|nr:metalloregulator ArsR/SmtB family transcription factor [Chromatiales bacterium]